MLENALNDRLTQALAGNHLIPDNDFAEWVRIVNRVAQKVEMADQRSRWTALHRTNVQTRAPEPRTEAPRTNWDVEMNQGGRPEPINRPLEVGDVDEFGDTVMGGINNAAVSGNECRRAKWKTRVELDRLREEGKCFRCERRGCASKKCPLLPAKKPKSKKLQVLSMNLPEIDPSVYNIDGIEVMESSVSEN